MNVNRTVQQPEERKRRLGDLDNAIQRGIADVEAGRAKDAAAVFNRLEAKYAQLAAHRGNR